MQRRVPAVGNPPFCCRLLHTAGPAGQEKIPVYIFPFKFSDEKNKNYSETYRAYPNILDFWKNLETGYNLFIKDLKELNISVDKLGNYQFSK